jgi:hypothetical protein
MKVHWRRHPEAIKNRLLSEMTVNLLVMRHNLLPMLQ